MVLKIRLKIDKEIRCSVCNAIMKVETTEDGIIYKCPHECESSTEVVI
jgi:phage FluMu protein Com